MPTNTLILLRHAKSDWHAGAGDDHARPLNERGERAAAVMGVYLAQRGLVPDLVLTSTATRARQTCEHVLRHGGMRVEAAAEPALYLASPQTILETVRGRHGAARTVLVVGHNPGMQDLVAMLAERAAAPLRAAASEGFPTAAIAIATTGEPWAAVTAATLTLADIAVPKALV
ncbi:MAG: histidine phosphatase family protein [Alphaproteobacteria bacterium]